MTLFQYKKIPFTQVKAKIFSTEQEESNLDLGEVLLLELIMIPTQRFFELKFHSRSFSNLIPKFDILSLFSLIQWLIYTSPLVFLTAVFQGLGFIKVLLIFVYCPL